ncbi:hypothetical protein BE21_21905 [Sorangium cellulosum]|uniref:Plasmid stabilization protein n=1 Tax=Sorangium cellulosum TaxID=56 RepID=A0A150TVL9_SORCE|nr:hypothetical protein BE21_21905 [Sorangium cellulosum]
MTPRSLAVAVTKRAAVEVATASAWWAENRPAAPGAVTDELARALSLLQTAPDAGVRVANARLAGVRRLFLERIDYHLSYQLSARRSRLTVLAFWHARRRPPLL